MPESPLALGSILHPLAFILRAIRPDLYPESVSNTLLLLLCNEASALGVIPLGQGFDLPFVYGPVRIVQFVDVH